MKQTQTTQSLSRRDFLKLSLTTTAAGLATGLSLPSYAQTSKNLLVVGGGFAGATAAKYLKLWGGNQVQVTLIEPKTHYVSPILSNLVITNSLTINQLTFSYADLQAKGVNLIHQQVESLDPKAHQLTLSDGQQLDYDKLILATGIDFEPIAGLDTNRHPHAWQAGEQTQQLASQLSQLKSGQNVVMSVPKVPYRCPPGPYERACLFADFIQQQGIDAKVVLLDQNEDILVEKDIFQDAFTNRYSNQLEYHSKVTIESYDETRQEVITNLGTITSHLTNLIPNQTAGKLILNNQLANSSDGKWAEVNPINYESTLHQDIHIIGDSQATAQPKAGHIANSEAKICADAILRELAGKDIYPEPITNSACYTPISHTEASWLTGTYRYQATTKTMEPQPNSFGSSSASSKNFSQMLAWSQNLFTDTFG